MTEDPLYNITSFYSTSYLCSNNNEDENEEDEQILISEQTFQELNDDVDDDNNELFSSSSSSSSSLSLTKKSIFDNSNYFQPIHKDVLSSKLCFDENTTSFSSSYRGIKTPPNMFSTKRDIDEKVKSFEVCLYCHRKTSSLYYGRGCTYECVLAYLLSNQIELYDIIYIEIERLSKSMPTPKPALPIKRNEDGTSHNIGAFWKAMLVQLYSVEDERYRRLVARIRKTTVSRENIADSSSSSSSNSGNGFRSLSNDELFVKKIRHC